MKDMMKGFRFGMLLQVAIGPICLFLISTSISSGVYKGLIGVAAVVIVDALYILFAILGLGMVLKKENVNRGVRYFGGVILLVFGLSMVLGVFDIAIIPGFSFVGESKHVFIKTLLMTLSNPLTILFWTGVFSAKISEDNMAKGQLYTFGSGAVLATLVFLSFIVLISDIISGWINDGLLSVVNVIVGLVIITFGVKTTRVRQLASAKE